MKSTTLIVCLLLCISFLNAQTLASNIGAFDSREELERQMAEEAASPDKIPEYFRHFRQLSTTFNGFLIQLTVSDLPLRRDYHLFSYFGNVFFERLKTGQYAYYIKVNFDKKSKVESFLKQVVIHNAPEAVVVKKKGI